MDSVAILVRGGRLVGLLIQQVEDGRLELVVRLLAEDLQSIFLLTLDGAGRRGKLYICFL